VVSQVNSTDAPSEAAGLAATNVFGVKLFLGSLSFLFAATILLYLVVLVPEDVPEQSIMPIVGLGMGLSTMLMLASSFTLWLALRAIRAGDQFAFKRMMTMTLTLAVGFLASQVFCWHQLVESGISLDYSNKHGALFLVMTVLHALHVVGGVVPLGLVTARARAGDYTAEDHGGAESVALYWHFLDVVWLIMLLAIVVTTA